MIKAFFFFLFLQISFGTPTVVVKGVVISFDQKTITLKNGKATLLVPRSSYPDLKKIVVGRTVIEVRMTPKQTLDLNPHFPSQK